VASYGGQTAEIATQLATRPVKKDIIVTEQPPRAVGRRQLLGVSMSTAGVIALAACDKPQRTGDQPGVDEVPVTPPEDLMREHGVLKRVLLIYREGLRRLQTGDELPAHALNAGAAIIRSFIEDYHEQLEEQHVFPKLEQAGKLADVTAVLRTQHQRGRVLTDRVLAATGAASALDQAKRDALVQDMSAFIRMYEPHEAREDTVVFPTLRQVVPAKEFRDMADLFEDEEHRRFGQAGFEGIVDKVADIEKELGIYDLSQFTPS
jgi:hemerythrin-like domain-containing protein